MKRLLAWLLLLAFLPHAHALTNVSSCQSLSTAGETYVLTADINDSFAVTCMDAIADNVVLDCNGRTIDGIDSNSSIGVNLGSNNSNITVENCTITDWNIGISDKGIQAKRQSIHDNNISSNLYGVLLSGSRNTVYNNSVNSNKEGIVFLRGSNTVYNNTLNSNQTDGLLFAIGSVYNTVYDNVANGNGYAIFLAGGYDTIYNNSLNDNSFGLYLSGSYSTVHHNNIRNNSYGLALSNNIPTTWSTGGTIYSNKFLNNTYGGILVSQSSNNKVYDNYFYSNNFKNPNVVFAGEVRANTWNTPLSAGTNIIGGSKIGGNYWADLTSQGHSQWCPDASNDGICDPAYTLAAGNVDSYPLANSLKVISSCTTLDESETTYVLEEDILDSNASTCMNITSGNVILDCNGRTIDGIDAASSAGVSSDSNIKGVAVRNCTITDWNLGILSDVNTIELSNNSVSSNFYGISLSGRFNTLYGNSSSNNSYGLVLSDSFTNNQVQSNRFLNNSSSGILIDSLTASNLFFDNDFNNFTNVTFPVGASANTWNVARAPTSTNIKGGSYYGGNYWATPDGTGFSQTCVADSDGDKLCDAPYPLTANNTDNVPLIETTVTALPITSCMVITRPGNYAVETSLVNASYTPKTGGQQACIHIQAPGVVLDCNEKVIDGDETIPSRSGIAVFKTIPRQAGVTGTVTLSNVTIRGCSVTDWSNSGIAASNTENLTLLNNRVTRNGTGFNVVNSRNGLMQDNELFDNATGFRLGAAKPSTDAEQGLQSTGNTFIKNTVTNNAPGVAITTDNAPGSMVTGNAFHGNVFNNSDNVSFLEAVDSGPGININEVSDAEPGNAIYRPASGAVGSKASFNDNANSWSVARGDPSKATGGNYWVQPDGNGFSETCRDADSDGFCDTQYDVRANAQYNSKSDSSLDNVDFFPLSRYTCNFNGSCNATENCSSCPSDCGACPPPLNANQCGLDKSCVPCQEGFCPAECDYDDACGILETCASCPSDCGGCTCNDDASCGATETCSSCPNDCGECLPSVSSASIPGYTGIELLMTLAVLAGYYALNRRVKPL